MKKEFNRRYEDLFKFVPIGFFTFDHEGRILEVNPTGAKLLGTRRSDLLKQKFANYIVDDFQDGFQHHCKKVFESGDRESYDLRIRKKNRTSFWAQLESIAIKVHNRGANGHHFNTAITDITDRKRAEDALCNALEKSNQQAREVSSLLESSRAVLQYREFKDSPKMNCCIWIPAD
jgi:PAS domain S-box-containing protein